MAQGSLLKVILWLIAFPHIIASLLLEVLATKKLRTDLGLCLTIAECYRTSIPNTFIKALVLAEDHRNDLHPGIDVIAMIRALWIRATSGQIQGASTIEQQYVRIISNRFERTVARKLREQLLALMLVRRADKQTIASAYLSIAHYGTEFIGIDGLKARYGENLSTVSFNQALQMVVQLKCPRPHKPNGKWHSKISARLDVLLSRVEHTANPP